MSIIIAHNHPSGNPLPSNADILITEQLFYAGKIIDIQLLDHLIIGEQSHEFPKGFYSFKEHHIRPFTQKNDIPQKTKKTK